jgi:hypothetical protein
MAATKKRNNMSGHLPERAKDPHWESHMNAFRRSVSNRSQREIAIDHVASVYRRREHAVRWRALLWAAIAVLAVGVVAFLAVGEEGARRPWAYGVVAAGALAAAMIAFFAHVIPPKPVDIERALRGDHPVIDLSAGSTEGESLALD